MKILSRKGCGFKKNFHLCAANDVIKAVYESGGEWFSRSLTDTAGTTIKNLGRADDFLILSDGTEVSAENGSLTIT